MTRAFAAFLAFALTTNALAAQSAPLEVVATTTDLGALASAVGGERVRVTVCAKPGEDPHFLEARPSLVKAMSRADVLLRIGLQLEDAWLPVLTANARNAAVLTDAAGDVDASATIVKRNVAEGPVDRSSGDVHPHGNPHYLTDPLCGLAVARVLRDRFTRLRPADADAFERGYTTLRRTLGEALVGARIAALYDFETLILLHEKGELKSFLDAQGDLDALGGLFADLVAIGPIDAVADHDLWPYFAARFGLRIHAHFEPKPGIPPTTRHLADVVATMKAHDVRVILSAPYFPPAHARFVANATGAGVAALAHQTGARDGCTDYVATVAHNVRAVLAAHRAAAPRRK